MASVNQTQDHHDINKPAHESKSFGEGRDGQSQVYKKQSDKQGPGKKEHADLEKSEEGRDKPQGFNKQASKIADDVGEKIQEKTSTIRKTMTNYINEHPVTALGTAFLVGLTVALLLKK